MNNKAQFDSIHPFSIVLAIFGGIFGVYLADRMFAGIVLKIIVFA